MKNFTLLCFLLISGALSAQYVYINAPADCEGGLRFGVTSDWGADLLSGSWTGDVEIVNDGSGLPTEGCNPLIGDLTGKIAFVDRGSCNFSLKALNAQTAGAIACVIANHTPNVGTITMGAGNFATDVTIPVVMISYEDGQLIRDKINMGTTVNMSIGDLEFQYDLGTAIESMVFPPYGAIPAHQVMDAGNILFTPGASVTNFGTENGSNVILEATIDFTPEGGSTTQVYEEGASLALIEPDSSGLIVVSDFDPSAHGEGRYDYSYTISSDNPDAVENDNTIGETFYVTDNVYAKARWDAANNRTIQTNAYTIAGGGPIEMLTGYEFPNGTDMSIDSVLFYVSTSNPTLAGTAVTAFLYEWDDMNDDGNYAADEVELVAFGFIDFDANMTEDNAWVSLPIENFQSAEPGYTIAGDGARYVIGTRYDGTDLVFFGFDEGASLDQYINGVVGPGGTYNDAMLPYSQSTSFGSFGADFDAIGLFTDNWYCSSTALYVNPLITNTDDLSEAEADILLAPNPTSDILRLDIELANQSNSEIQYRIVDALGRTLFSDVTTGLFKDSKTFDVGSLSAGRYEVIITADDGTTSRAFIKQ